MGFKESLQHDLETTFFNLDEFAEEYSWQKGTINGILDSDDLIKKYSAEFDALPQGSHLLYVSKSQFTENGLELPSINSTVVFEHNLYTVNEIKKESGMVAIFLYRGKPV